MNVTLSSQSKHASVTVIYSECAHGMFQSLFPATIPVFSRKKQWKFVLRLQGTEGFANKP